MIILGIDPGSRITGFGVIKVIKSKNYYITSGCIKTDLKKDIPYRLKEIFKGLEEVIKATNPNFIVIEQIFMAKNIQGALKLGQARGVSLCIASIYDIEVFEYSAKQIKNSVVGTGQASKNQVQFMVQHLLKLDKKPQVDASDALACALCHSNSLLNFQGKIKL